MNNLSPLKKKSFLPLKLSFEQLSILGIAIGVDRRNILDYILNYIYAWRRGSFILDLRIILKDMRFSIYFIERIVSFRGKIAFINSNLKFNTFEITKLLFLFYKLNQSFWDLKWKGGFYTNFKLFFYVFFLSMIRQKKVGILSVYDSLKYDYKKKMVFLLKRIPNLILTMEGIDNKWVILESGILKIPCIFFFKGSYPFFFNSFFIVGNISIYDVLKFYIEFLLLVIVSGIIMEILLFKLSLIEEKYLNVEEEEE